MGIGKTLPMMVLLSKMKTVFMLCLALGVAISGLPSPAAAAGLPETIQRVKRSVLGVGTVQYTRRPPGKFGGTGFVVADGRHVITNAHTIPEKLDDKYNEFLAVLVPETGERIRKATVVASDAVHDLALLQIAGKQLPPLALGDSARVREGELYAFTGFPLGVVIGMYPVTHRGIISAISPVAVPQISARHLTGEVIQRLRDPYDVFQLDATAYPGNSGSPLYDPGTGAVVGVINKVFVKQTKENVLKDPSGITYAVPIRHARQMLRRAGLKDVR